MDATTQYLRLLSTPVSLVTTRLLVAERPLPACAERGDKDTFAARFRLQNKTVKERKQTATTTYCVINTSTAVGSSVVDDDGSD